MTNWCGISTTFVDFSVSHFGKSLLSSAFTRLISLPF
jgi:hypothetical protein